MASIATEQNVANDRPRELFMALAGGRRILQPGSVDTRTTHQLSYDFIFTISHGGAYAYQFSS